MVYERLGVLLALGFTALIAIWAIWKSRRLSRSGHEGEDSSYFTARGTLTPARLFFSVFATTFSAFTVVGLPAMFFAQGIGTFIWMGVGILLTPLTLQLIGKRIVARNRHAPAASPIGLLMNEYGSRSLMVTLSAVTVIVLFPYLVLQIAGIGKFILSASDGNLSYIGGMIFVCVVVGGYIFTGGAIADAETDFIQGPILLLGVLALGGLIAFEFFAAFQENWGRLAAAELTSLPGPNGYFTPATLISFGIIFTLISVSTPQVSQRLMAATSPRELNPIIKIYAFVGLVVVAFAGLMGLYAASNLQIATPDFVAGDVLRALADRSSGSFRLIFFFVGVLFTTAVISAALSTIDSVLLAITGIASDNIRLHDKASQKRLKPLSWVAIAAGLAFASNPPRLITDLAAVQLSGLTALLPCLFGPLFGYTSRVSGWSALMLGLLPVLLARLAGVSFYGYDAGVIGLVLGILGLQLGRLDRTTAKPTTASGPREADSAEMRIF